MKNDVVGVGYEGQELDEFLSSLVGLGVRTLVDVRLTPISRKRGFSKRALAEAAESVGIEYEHLRSLGNPKDNRTGFAGGPDELTEARARYRGLLETASRVFRTWVRVGCIRESRLVDHGGWVESTARRSSCRAWTGLGCGMSAGWPLVAGISQPENRQKAGRPDLGG
jgi:hypothetical protein